ncbi:serine-threonine protein kinase, putative [Entamoeba invadens IP1]|uniref:Serine-threonine protein kinase, putative n=1 Tax=Entamoeba invadens IP1 TaxID=370355 RepID=A0A0A1UDZ5_ENTIV|nr:serine-threonine protein kinase, putative [Entamoeba invadens IP1]ELP94815.1 serine-threonine protein kinase, putative [Entamoeba invadens IP1]|eukprot:XP_004261586.1 serine-threonine protein kinase, putative [Entamoeba invadens IP1]
MVDPYDCVITVTLITSEEMLQYLNYPIYNVTNLKTTPLTSKLDFAQLGVLDRRGCSSQPYILKLFFFILVGEIPNKSRILFSSSNGETQMFEYTRCENETKFYGKCHCVNGTQTRRDLWKLAPETGFVYSTQETTFENYVFKLFSKNMIMRTEFSMRVICPNNCNEERGGGKCSVQLGKCICSHGSYGGDDCHKLCYYNNTWTLTNYDDKCYFGEEYCDTYCECENGTYLLDHHCLNEVCYSNNITDYPELCKRGESHCKFNCQCEDGYIIKNNKCITQTCGNGKLDHPEEQCDSGNSCNSTNCKCYEGFVPDPDNKGSCKGSNYTLIITLVITCTVLLLTVLIISTVTTIIVSRKDHYLFKNVIEAIEYPQPEYYFDVSKCHYIAYTSNKYPSNKSIITFGMKNKQLKINETVFEIFEMTNHTKRFMLIIFHTPNIQKYTVHFCPQTLIISKGKTKQILLIFTPHCTTRFEGTEFYVSVYYGDKSTLIELQQLVFDKKKIDVDDTIIYEKIHKRVSAFYFVLISKVEIEGSFQIDRDELFVSPRRFETKGNHKHAIVGTYRGKPVTVKTINLSNLSTQDLNTLKASIEKFYTSIKNMRSPYLLQPFGCFYEDQNLSFFSEICCLGSADLYFLNSEYKGRFSYSFKLKVMKDVQCGLSYLHGFKLFHLNLKLSNVMMKSFSASPTVVSVQLCDHWGSADLRTKVEDNGLFMKNPRCDPPEAYKHIFGSFTDVYSFGILCWEFFYEQRTFGKYKTLFDIKSAVITGLTPEIDSTMPSDLKWLILKCWEYKYLQRITLRETHEILHDIIRKEETLKSAKENNKNIENEIFFEQLKNEKMILYSNALDQKTLIPFNI